MSISVKTDVFDIYHKKTRVALFLTSILQEPLFTLFSLCAFILRKDLGATAFQIAVLTMLRPLVSILSYYWSSLITKRKDRLRSNFLLAGFLSCLPFLFFPIVSNSWFVIAGAAIYVLFYRGGSPAWIEILKQNMSKKARENIFSWGSAIGYLEGVFLAIGIGKILDHHTNMWRWLFFGAAILRIVNFFLLIKIPIKKVTETEKKINKSTFKELVMEPWRNSYKLMKTRPDFSRFQWGFMISGFGIMLIQPALPLFFVDKLKLSYTDLAIALSICKGLGFAFFSPFWAKVMGKSPIMKLSSLVFLCVGFFPLLLLFSSFHIAWVYLAYFFYGIAQGGSHLIWNLSGPVFAGTEDSSPFTSVNVAMVGVRGAIAPPIGGLLAVFFGPIFVLFLGIFFSFYSGIKMLSKKKSKIEELLESEIS